MGSAIQSNEPCKTEVNKGVQPYKMVMRPAMRCCLETVGVTKRQEVEFKDAKIFTGSDQCGQG